MIYAFDLYVTTQPACDHQVSFLLDNRNRKAEAQGITITPEEARGCTQTASIASFEPFFGRFGCLISLICVRPHHFCSSDDGLRSLKWEPRRIADGNAGRDGMEIRKTMAVQTFTKSSENLRVFMGVWDLREHLEAFVYVSLTRFRL
ncbi:hypothetical protein L596_004726 [Steinernema carpocapsae]|uniref:Uncharacterized protein n=1 Tax=Steinernema carpocapsae TaxID=34508 RepID=A0A4U8V0A2_STECR|nr:hypothetical protein L596_004726 [Steinernema carpocapsae]